MTRDSTARRFHLLDGIGLIAATAIGFAVARSCTLQVLDCDLGPYPMLARTLLTIWVYILAALPVPALWSIALFAMYVRRPRPPLRLLANQPGFVACGAVSLVAAIRLAGFLTMVARTVGNRFLTMSLNVFDLLSVTVSYPGSARFVKTIYTTSYFAASAFGISAAVAAAWLLLAVGGHWRSEPHWLDRFGRILGGYWIAIIPFSCWWDYHILY